MDISGTEYLIAKGTSVKRLRGSLARRPPLYEAVST